MISLPLLKRNLAQTWKILLIILAAMTMYTTVIILSLIHIFTGHALIQVSEEGENCIILFNGSNYENGREFINQVLEDFGEGDILVLQNEISNLPYLLEKGAAMGMRILFNPSPMNESLKKTDPVSYTHLDVYKRQASAPLP